MRRLIYIPIIHLNPDLGSLKRSFKRRAKKLIGTDNWQKHEEVINRYWLSIENFWKEKKVLGFKIFQDSLAANGSLGKQIIHDLAEKGSINYRIIRQLVEKGAKLVKTEDADLLKEEYFMTKELIKKKSFLGALFAFLNYRLRKDTLLTKRDAYIIRRIDENLKEEETGICFLGAYHKVLPSLPKDIKVIALRDPGKVKEYYSRLTNDYRRGVVNDLGRCLTKPIKIHLGNNYA